ncbi:hypothetical protein FHS99_002241 [Sphingomonas prati]|uniref:Uncharacterized protein n=1 Tax=Sphingomonas prati TaxID=1843237 RepID=A0A7W9BTK1_9SPHN|nr:hypothetical protein [Sphingomonas prati]
MKAKRHGNSGAVPESAKPGRRALSPTDDVGFAHGLFWFGPGARAFLA